jgi:hypothetical protein
VSRVFDELPPIVALAELRHSKATALATRGNDLVFIDWAKNQALATRVKFESKIVSVTSIDRNIFVTFSEKGVLSLFDTRVSVPVATSRFKDYLTGVSMCAWQNYSFLGLGFQEGIVQLFDLNSMLPIKMILTPPPLFLNPVARNVCNFVVGSPTGIECFDGFLGTSELCVPVRNGVIAPFDGGSVCVTESASFFLDCQNFEESIVLADNRQVALMEYFASMQPVLQLPLRVPEALHQHSSPVTTLGIANDICITGDESGFVNFWGLTNAV